MTTSRPAAVIVLAAGEGTRMKSATPKVLHSIGGRTLLGHAIAAARGVDPQHLAIVIRHVDSGPNKLPDPPRMAAPDDLSGRGRAVVAAVADGFETVRQPGNEVLHVVRFKA